MTGDTYPDVSFESRMGSVEFRVHERPHITVDDRKCVDCSVRGCITACPANLFVPTADGGILFNYEQCFECGTCYLVCNEEGAITWTYPDGGHGVVFHLIVTARIAVCVKWIDLNPDVDPLHGTVEPHRHGAGFSESDSAAVEVALRLGEDWGTPVVVACVGPPAADAALRELLACGVAHAVRVQVEPRHGGAPSSAQVARLLASVWPTGDERPQLVVCGDASADRGSGSVPAFLAHELGAVQALGLIELAGSAPGRLTALRRLDGGRRERLTVGAPAVVSVEGSLASLRRAPLAATLATRTAAIDVRVAVLEDSEEPPRLQPWRPRPRALPPPAGERALDRIVALTGALVDRTPPRTLVLDPPDAADAILQQLRQWGYLPDDG